MSESAPTTLEGNVAEAKETLPGKTVAQVDYEVRYEQEGDLVITFEDGSAFVITGDYLNWGIREPVQEDV